MNIAITSNTVLPVEKYGGAERVIWELSRELSILGHNVYLITPPGTVCDFAQIIKCNPATDISGIIPKNIDLIHFFSKIPRRLKFPYIYTAEGNGFYGQKFSRQTVFVSHNQAFRHGGDCVVYNGLTPCETNLAIERKGFHFLGKAAWRRKNVNGAIVCARKAKSGKIDILGGNRLNFNMGFRFTLDRNARFHGMVNNFMK